MKNVRSFILLCFLTVSVYSEAQTFPAGFNLNPISSGWSAPAGASFNKSGTKLFVWEKSGLLYICKWNSDSLKYIRQLNPVVDITPEVGNWQDHGLLGFAADPDFDNNGLIYLMYVVDRHYLLNFGTPSYDPTANEYNDATIGRITRYKTTLINGDVIADLSSRKILLGESKSNGIPILYKSHGVGSLQFAPDGTLLASAGDGASFSSVDAGSASESFFAQALADGIIRPNENVGAFRSQMINSLSGKILRLDPNSGDGVPSNPFYSASSPRSASSRVWAFGFRNPFRFSIKPNTGSTDPTAANVGELYIGDVGYNTYEELDIVTEAGTNCGWPVFEGFTPTKGYDTAITYNMDQPNPLFGTNGCTQQYFSFQDLIKQVTVDNNHIINNPCDGSQPISPINSNQFYHKIPALDWKHGADSTRVGIFTGNAFSVAQIGSPQSGVTGIPFRGNTSIGGCWYTGIMFPGAYKNTFFQADYGGKWLKNMTIQNTGVVQRVDSFASGFAAIVCVIQDPLDGSLVYVDLGTKKVIQVTSGNNVPLPLNLISFAVSPKTNGNLAKWTTESELYADSFILERSSNGTDFTPINRQTAVNLPGQNEYSFNDIVFPPGTLYYRLRMIDKTGNFHFSDTIRIANNSIVSDDRLFIIPNPVLENFSLEANFSENEQIQIRIMDAEGRLVKSFYEMVNTGINNLTLSNMENLEAGIYFLEVRQKNKIRKTKFLKIR